MSLVMERLSVREYTDKEISNDTMQLILQSAMQAPSAHNQQAWEFIVVDDKEILEKLSKASSGAWMLKDCNKAIIVLMRKEQKAPLMIQQDMGAVTENILLEAANLGIGSCWIGAYPLQERLDYIHEVLNIKEQTVFCQIALGYPKNKKEVKSRYDASRVHYNRLK